MVTLVYTGQVPLHVLGGGNVEPGAELLVSDELAAKLLLRPDFTQKKAKARPRKATTTQEVCANNRS